MVVRLVSMCKALDLILQSWKEKKESVKNVSVEDKVSLYLFLLTEFA